VKTPSALTVAGNMANAQALKEWLDQRSDKVVLLVRQGQDMERYHLRYSHAAWAVRQNDGHWRVYHNLNECGTGHSSLYVQGLYEFLADDLFRTEVAVLRPSGRLQEQLLSVLANSPRLNLLHSSLYNMAAYPFSGPYQNSNGWVLEVFAQANQAEPGSRDEARRWLSALGYQPSELEVGRFQRGAAKLFTQNIFTDDQPDSLLDEGKIQISSGDSVIRFIARYSQPVVFCDHQTWGTAVCIFSLKQNGRP
jgi:Uncharacterized protein conserved in bacteria